MPLIAFTLASMPSHSSHYTQDLPIGWYEAFVDVDHIRWWVIHAEFMCVDVSLYFTITPLFLPFFWSSYGEDHPPSLQWYSFWNYFQLYFIISHVIWIWPPSPTFKKTGLGLYRHSPYGDILDSHYTVLEVNHQTLFIQSWCDQNSFSG